MVERIDPFAGNRRLGDPVNCILDQFIVFALGDVVCHPESAIFRHRRNGCLELHSSAADDEIIFDLGGLFCFQDLMQNPEKFLACSGGKTSLRVFPSSSFGDLISKSGLVGAILQ